MTLSVEAESLAKEALKAAEDARKAQQRLQMLKKRYGMMKKTPQDDATVPAVPTKPAMEVIDPTPIKKVDHHTLHEEESTDPTIETRGTGSVATNDETRATGSVATNDKADDHPTMQSFINNPPPPPPPKVIRAMSPRKEEHRPEPRETREEPVRVMAEPSENVVQQREQQEEEELVVHKIVDEQKILLQVQEEITPSEPATPIEHTDDSTAATPEHSNIQTKNETHVEAAPKEALPQEPVTPAVVVAAAPMEPVQLAPTPEPVVSPSPAAVVVEEPKQETAAVVETKQPQSQPQQARPKAFSFYEAQTATLAVVQEGSEDSDRSQEMEQYPNQPLEPASVEPPVQQQPMQVLRAAPEPKKTEPQEGAASLQMMTMVDPNQQQRRGPPTAAAGNQAQYQRPKPAYMEAEAMLGAMLNEPRPMTSPRQRRQPPPVGKAMPEMAVSASPAASSHYYSVNETLQPIDELQQRVAAIPETTDDFPIHHPYQYQDPHHHPYQYQDPHYGSYHYGDDVSVLTEHFNYGKPTSPRHVNQEPPIAEEAPFREPPESRMEEGSLYGDAPERDTRFFQPQPPESDTRFFQPQPEPQAQSYQSFQSFHQQGNFRQQGNFQPPESPRFRNNAADGALGALSPRSQDPAGQLEPDQKDPRQPQIQDPPQINSRQFDSEAGRGMEPSEVRMSPLISHLRNRTEPEGKGRNHVPRPNRRVNLSVDPYSPRNPHMGDEAVSPLSASGQSTTRHYQNRAGPVGHQTPYGGYASGSPMVSNMPQMQHRYITTRSGAASVASYHRANYPGDATVMSHQPMMMMMRGGSPMHNSSPVHFHSGGSVSSMPNQRTEFFHGGNVAFHEHRFVPSGGASVAHSMGGETIISVRTNARGNKVVKKLVKVEEENETDPVVAFCDMINIDKVCGIEFDEQYKVVEEELPPEPLTAADVGRNAAMGKKVFNENNYTDPFAGRHNEAGLCGLL